MVIMELLGMNGSGKTTTIGELHKCCDLDLPPRFTAKDSYLVRNCKKAKKVWVVLGNDRLFAIKLFGFMQRKHGWSWDAISSWFNICAKGYNYLFSEDRRIVLGGGIIHRVWDAYGMYPIRQEDRKEIAVILSHFPCKDVYYLDVPKAVILERNAHRGRRTLLERHLDELDFIYENYYIFLDLVKEIVEIKAVKAQSTEDRVRFLLEDCQALKSHEMMDGEKCKETS